MKEVPSSSASSVAPSAATTPAAAKTAAAIQEANDENEPGWIFGMVDGSVASVTTDRDDMWDELVLDSGSVSAACPYAWCSDISVNDKEKSVFAGHSATQNTIFTAHELVPLEQWGPEGSVRCKVKFDVADVAYPSGVAGKDD